VDFYNFELNANSPNNIIYVVVFGLAWGQYIDTGTLASEITLAPVSL